jgi:hypothetical protein
LNKEGREIKMKTEKVINPIMAKMVGVHQECFRQVFCEIVYKDGILSISGVVGPQKNGSCIGSCGQIQDVIAGKDGARKLNKGWNLEKLETFLTIWNKYHLNDKNPECEHQRALGWREEAREDLGDRGETRGTTFYKDDQKGLLEKPCPICGYGYGTEWRRMKVPDWVLEFLNRLPESEITPTWVWGRGERGR